MICERYLAIHDLWSMHHAIVDGLSPPKTNTTKHSELDLGWWIIGINPNWLRCTILIWYTVVTLAYDAFAHALPCHLHLVNTWRTTTCWANLSLVEFLQLPVDSHRLKSPLRLTAMAFWMWVLKIRALGRVTLGVDLDVWGKGFL